MNTTVLDERPVRRGDLVVFEKPGFGADDDSPEPQFFEVKRVIDNRGQSSDSRGYGSLPLTAIHGVVIGGEASAEGL